MIHSPSNLAAAVVIDVFSNYAELLHCHVDLEQVELIQVIEKGGNCQVWFGKYQDRDVPIKYILMTKSTVEDATQFASEIRVLAKLTHPNIIISIGAACSTILDICAIT